MAGKITEYPVTATAIGDNDFFDISKEISGGVYESQKINAQDALGLAKNLSNSNLTQTGVRTYDCDFFNLSFLQGMQFYFESLRDPGPGNPSFLYKGFGSLSGNVLMEMRNGLNQTALKSFGDLSHRFYGRVGIGAAPTTGLLHMEGVGGLYNVETSNYGIGVYSSAYFSFVGRPNGLDGGISFVAQNALTQSSLKGSVYQFQKFTKSTVSTITAPNEADHDVVTWMSDAGGWAGRTLAWKDEGVWRDVRTGFDATEVRGASMPRLTAAEGASIVSPQPGEYYFQTDEVPGVYTFDGTQWQRLAFA